ncbi:MAG: PadR family transcriptional regulator [Nitriliruptoraceae bacterium]|nr:PadR family transcriptional regulator [Nitriliruptoraceae bacterium]
MTTAHDVQMLKGALRLALLRLLAERESYGYELVLRLHDLGLVDVAEGSVYPAITRLERDGLASSRLVPSSSGPARKYYHLTEAGTVALRDATAAWHHLVDALAPLLAREIPAEPAPPGTTPTDDTPPAHEAVPS